ncbi:DNA repair protein XRCC1-like isoform X2 [Epargyreus clarus]|uniref:DNA repair protein XRCC1-like isoform X2 n=1 Tax=Epargyreus clarus TaxID=520877 RepID=UPI003C2AD797
MPRVKIAYIVSFSSEDPDNRADNLLSPEVSKKKWLCSHWEPSCSVVLQLERAVEISAIQIGAHNAALVEVLIGLSERPNDPFQVLVPSCVFQPAAEARRGAAPDRVRSFARAELAARGRADRLRVVCTQPYNKHCKYGLSFVHVHEAEAARARLLLPDAPSSDEDDFRPGELFARRHLAPLPAATDHTTTSAQISQATSRALKNVSESSTKLVKAAISTPGTSRQKQTDSVHADRRRDTLMYTDDDDKPHDKIDRVVNRHKNEKNKEDELNKTKYVEKDKEKNNFDAGEQGNTKNHKDIDNNQNNKNKKALSTRDTSVHTERDKPKDSARGPEKDTETHQKKQSQDQQQKTGAGAASLSAGPACAEGAVLRGVELALSGYAGARRAGLRALALRLGARYAADYTPRCTHLVCAFPNTPKLRAVRAASSAVGVATAEWLEQCAARRRRLPWQWFATLPAERLPAQPLDDPAPPAATNKRDLSDEDTDDEIEKHLNAKKKARTASPRASPTDGAAGGAGSGAARGADASSDSDDVAFVRDERFRGHVTLDSDDDGDRTDCDDAPATVKEERIDPSKV